MIRKERITKDKRRRNTRGGLNIKLHTITHIITHKNHINIENKKRDESREDEMSQR